MRLTHHAVCRLAPGKWKVGTSQGHFAGRARHACIRAVDLGAAGWLDGPGVDLNVINRGGGGVEAIHAYEPGMLKLYVGSASGVTGSMPRVSDGVHVTGPIGRFESRKCAANEMREWPFGRESECSRAMYDDIGTQYQLAYALYKRANIDKARGLVCTLVRTAHLF
jgi:hypothetical protein